MIRSLLLFVLLMTLLLGALAILAPRVDPPRALESLPVERCK